MVKETGVLKLQKIPVINGVKLGHSSGGKCSAVSV